LTKVISIKLIIFFLFFIPGAINSKGISCNFEEVYTNNEIQNGYFLLEGKNFRYEYNDDNLYTIVNNDRGTFIIQNYDKNLINSINDHAITAAMSEIYNDYPNIEEFYEFNKMKFILEKSQEHNFLKRMSVISNKLNLSIFFNNCENIEIDKKFFKERLIIDNL
jgi:hypothetical protein